MHAFSAIHSHEEEEMTMSRYVAALCRAGFKKADANHDGKIQPEEFDRSLADTPGKTAAEHH